MSDNSIIYIGGIGLFLYLLSTADWPLFADILEKVGLVLFGVAILKALSELA